MIWRPTVSGGETAFLLFFLYIVFPTYIYSYYTFLFICFIFNYPFFLSFKGASFDFPTGLISQHFCISCLLIFLPPPYLLHSYQERSNLMMAVSFKVLSEFLELLVITALLTKLLSNLRYNKYSISFTDFLTLLIWETLPLFP